MCYRWNRRGARERGNRCAVVRGEERARATGGSRKGGGASCSTVAQRPTARRRRTFPDLPRAIPQPLPPPANHHQRQRATAGGMELAPSDRDVHGTKRDLAIFTYAVIGALGTLLIFLYGFFPIKYADDAVATFDDIPDHVEHVRVNTDQLYRPLVKKVVVLVIDALRWDFITGPIGVAAMPITNHLIKSSSSCLMQARASPPTVTMPRLKAMMTGAVPSFVDVALNFGDLPVSGDSLILQARNQGHKLHFFGDDTWLKIFPDMFERYEGTTSFFVTDFTEVDDNVTRHVPEELQKKEDWSVLILHYLGLDHIGHVAGPFSPLIKPKLMEMDKIIGDIHRSVQNWSENGLPALLVICGDHGMKDSGGHGGSTAEETLVPFLAFGTNCSSKTNKPNRMSQVDIAPTLSMMLGIPIPLSNVGSIPINMLNGLSDASKLFVLYYNSRQVFQHFGELPDYKSSRAYEYYKEATKLHVNWLTNRKESADAGEVLVLYNKALQEMKETLIRSMIEYDLHAMTIAMMFMAHITLIMANKCTYRAVSLKNKCCWFVGSLMVYVLLRFLWESQLDFLTLVNLKNITLTTIAIGFTAINSHLCSNLSLPTKIMNRLLNLSLRDLMMPVGMIAHIISLTSSSFVEEEHQTWYFFWATFLILLLCGSARKFANPKLCVKIFLALLGHRVLRKLNSTGNKYAHLPDIANWLRDQENNAAMTAFLLAALSLLVWLGYRCEEKRHRNKTLFFHIAAATCIYLRHMAHGNVAKFYDISSKGIVEVRFFWIIILLYTLYWVYRFSLMPKRKVFVNSLLRFVIQLWILISAILHRPHNVILLPMQLICSFIIHAVLGLHKSEENVSVYAHIWMGNVFYFYQGNSNSLATIDVAAGYVGLESYRPVVTGIFMSINTYSAPVLAYFTLVAHSMKSDESYSYSDKILSINRRYALWRFLPAAVYTVIVTLQRFHLFVWTVFSPKLLYEAMHCLVSFIVMLMLQLICIMI